MQLCAYGVTERSPIRIHRIIQSADAFHASARAHSVEAFGTHPQDALLHKLLSRFEHILEQRTPHDLPQSESRLLQSLQRLRPLRRHLGGELKMAGRKVYEWVRATGVQIPGEREVYQIMVR